MKTRQLTLALAAVFAAAPSAEPRDPSMTMSHMQNGFRSHWTFLAFRHPAV